MERSDSTATASSWGRSSSVADLLAAKSAAQRMRSKAQKPDKPGMTRVPTAGLRFGAFVEKRAATKAPDATTLSANTLEPVRGPRARTQSRARHARSPPTRARARLQPRRRSRRSTSTPAPTAAARP